MTSEQRRPPRDDEEAAAFKGMGHAITIIRERRRIDRKELATQCEMTPAELEEIERGELDQRWGTLRVVAYALERSLSELLVEAEESAPGLGGEQWRRRSREAEEGGTAARARSDAAEGSKLT